MNQTRLGSLIEALTNTIVGGLGAWVIVYACMTLIKDPALAATVSVCLCAVWSLLRSYTLRRVFAQLEKP